MNSSRNRKKERGVATILVVGVLLFFLLFFFVLAIDFAFVYTVRGQLQNAADAAALAGVELISSNKPATGQAQARAEAQKFALENYAAGQAVVLENSDIEFGFWNGTSFIPNPPDPPINAIKVTAKRIAERDNAVKLYFGHIVGWPTMDIVRVAIASRPARAEVPIALCYKACSNDPNDPSAGVINSAGTRFDWTQGNQTITSFAMTSFDPKKTNVPDALDYVCGKVFDSCYETIDTTQGMPESAFRNVRCAFLNPLYDSGHKTCVIDANLDNVADQTETEVPCTTAGSNIIVSSWSPLVPLLHVDQCTTPTYQPDAGYEITGYARAKIVDIYPRTSPSSGEGNNCACNELANRGYSYVDPPRFYNYPYLGSLDEPAIIINGIECASCEGDIKGFTGKRGFLVR